MDCVSSRIIIASSPILQCNELFNQLFTFCIHISVPYGVILASITPLRIQHCIYSNSSTCPNSMNLNSPLNVITIKFQIACCANVSGMLQRGHILTKMKFPVFPVLHKFSLCFTTLKKCIPVGCIPL